MSKELRVSIRLTLMRMGTMSIFCEDGSEHLSNCHVSCRCRVRQQPAAAPKWSRSVNTPTPPSAARTPSPNTSWSQIPANERGTAATRTTPRPDTVLGKAFQMPAFFLTNAQITVNCTSVQLNCCHLTWRLPSVFLSNEYLQSNTA